MLYKKNDTKTLDLNLFKNPTSEYRGTPFWSWNCKLDKGQLMRQIEHLRDMGFGGFHIHSRTGLATEYLSDEFMDMVTACCDKAETENMLAWLYDEDRWSSGAAGGKVTKTKKFRRKRLKMFTEDKGWNTPKEEAIESGLPYLLSCYDILLDNEGYLESYSRIGIQDTAKGIKWYAYCINEKEDAWFNYQTYFDAMDKEAVAEFINVTHERYKEVIGERFDRSVPAIFTDEPNADHEKIVRIPTPEYKGEIKRAWTRFYEKEFKKLYGEDVLDTLPELIWNKKDGSDSLVKYKHFNFIAKQFSENFSKQIGDWCDKNGIAFTGHLLREPKLELQSITCGEVMRNYGYFGIPGIDILCNMREFTTAKQTQSAVHQYGKEGMLSELYGVTNWDFDFRGHKLQGDWQAALGVSVRVPHLAWVSMKGEAKRDYPAAIGYQSPWYKEYSYIEDHFARVNTVLTRGKPIINIGVIHPIESFWIISGPNSQCSTKITSLENNFRNITSWLLESHLDFNFICESTIPSLEDKNNPGTIGKMHYDTIVVPGCLNLRNTTVDYLENFVKAGGKVIFMGECPTHIDGKKSKGAIQLFEKSICIGFDKASVNSALADNREVEILLDNGFQADEFIYNYRQDNNCRWLFVARSKDPGIVLNDSSNRCAQKDVVEVSVRNTVITVKGKFIPTEYNTISGEIVDIEYEYINGNTVIKKALNGFDSLLLCLSNEKVDTTQNIKEYDIVNEFDIKKPVDYILSEPNVLLLDRAEYAYDNGEWQPEEEVLRISENFRKFVGFRSNQTQPYAIELQPAKNIVHLRYTFESEIVVNNALLAIEDADVINITFNGKPIEKEITGYFTDESIATIKLPSLCVGKNIIEVDMPFNERTNIEWCYILGDFGVRLMGCYAVITNKQTKLGFSDITDQGFPFYSANITYNFDVDMETDGAIEINASYYRGSLIGVSLDGERVDRIVLPPYNTLIENVKKGKHTVSLTLFGNRHNSFGALHLVNEGEKWFGPDAWHTSGTNWCYEYRLRPLGILKSPVIKILKKNKKASH